MSKSIDRVRKLTNPLSRFISAVEAYVVEGAERRAGGNNFYFLELKCDGEREAPPMYMIDDGLHWPDIRKLKLSIPKTELYDSMSYVLNSKTSQILFNALIERGYIVETVCGWNLAGPHNASWRRDAREIVESSILVHVYIMWHTDNEWETMGGEVIQRMPESTRSIYNRIDWTKTERPARRKGDHSNMMFGTWAELMPHLRKQAVKRGDERFFEEQYQKEWLSMMRRKSDESEAKDRENDKDS